MTAQKTLVTADDLLRPPYASMRCELLDSEVSQRAPTGEAHAFLANRFGRVLSIHVDTRHLGRVYSTELGFRIRRDPDTVRAPDVLFVIANRLRAGPPSSGFLEMAPDLVVEVVSPNDTAAEVQREMEDWLAAGVRLVWVVYPETESVVVYRSRTDHALLKIDDTLDGGDVLPGFSVPLKEIFG